MTELAITLAATLLAMQAQPTPTTEASEANPVEEPQTAEQVAQTEASDDDKIICRRTAITGSKFKKKICGTKKEWETLANRGSKDTRELQRRGKGLEPVN